jgi:hypothetical protein
VRTRRTTVHISAPGRSGARYAIVSPPAASIAAQHPVCPSRQCAPDRGERRRRGSIRLASLEQDQKLRVRPGDRRTGKRGAHAPNLVRRGPWHLDQWRLGADGRCPVGGFSIVTWSCGDRSGPRYHTNDGCPWGSNGTPCAIGAAIPGAESYLAHAFRSPRDDASGRYGLASPPAPPDPNLPATASSGATGSAQRTGKNPITEHYTDCVKLWDNQTHMSKSEWSRTCRRIENRLQNLRVENMDANISGPKPRRTGKSPGSG